MESRPYSEDDPPPIDYEDNLKWRADPEESFSDWTIEIVTTKPREEDGESAETVTTYHVHKSDLACGTRKSDYFAKLFRSSQKYNESNACTSRIELEPLASEAFPALLDYIYDPGRLLKINTRTATALLSLGDYFEIRHLRWDAKQFCQLDMALNNIHVYYEHATFFANEIILDILAQFIGKHLLDIAPSSEIVKKAEPAFWVKVASAVRTSTAGCDNEALVDSLFSFHWSKLVSEIGTLKVESLEKGIFDELTSAQNMPCIDENVALTLCELDDGLHEDDDADPGSMPLQKRCGVALASKWGDFTPDEATVQMLEQRNPLFLVALLLKSLENAREELASKDKQFKATRDALENAESTNKSLSSSLYKCQMDLGRCQTDLRRARGTESWEALKKLRLIDNPSPPTFLPPSLSYCTYSSRSFPQEFKELFRGISNGGNKSTFRAKDGKYYPVFYLEN